jgi:hypothetical protein
MIVKITSDPRSFISPNSQILVGPDSMTVSRTVGPVFGSVVPIFGSSVFSCTDLTEASLESLMVVDEQSRWCLALLTRLRQ